MANKLASVEKLGPFVQKGKLPSFVTISALRSLLLLAACTNALFHLITCTGTDASSVSYLETMASAMGLCRLPFSRAETAMAARFLDEPHSDTG